MADNIDWRKQRIADNIWMEKAKINGLRIAREINNLKLLKQKEFWDQVKEISSLFKELKPLTKEDRSSLWEKFHEICQATKEKQQKEYEKRRIISKNKRALIEPKIREAHYYVAETRNRDDVAQARSLLKEALDWMKDGWGGFNTATQVFNLNDGKMLKEDREVCWNYWLEVNNEVNRKYNEIRESGKKRHDEWRQQMESNIDRWENLIDKNENIIHRLEDQVSDLEYKARTARTDEFADVVRGWINEKLQKISDIRQTNSNIEGKISSVKNKITR